MAETLYHNMNTLPSIHVSLHLSRSVAGAVLQGPPLLSDFVVMDIVLNVRKIHLLGIFKKIVNKQSMPMNRLYVS